MIQAFILLIIAGIFSSGTYYVVSKLLRNNELSTMYDLLTELNNKKEVINDQKVIEDTLVDLHLNNKFCPQLTELQIRNFIKKRFE